MLNSWGVGFAKFGVSPTAVTTSLPLVMTALQSSPVPADLEAGPLLTAILDAKAATSAATQGDALRPTVEALVAQARSLDATVLHGASDIGHVLAGAMAYVALEMDVWTPGVEVEHVLLIDGALASETGPRWRMEVALATGAARVDALVLSAPEETAGTRKLGGRVFGLRTLELAA